MKSRQSIKGLTLLEEGGCLEEGADGVSPNLSPKAKNQELMSNVQGWEKMDIYLSISGERKFILCLFVLFGPSMDWIMPTHTGKSQVCFIQCNDSNTTNLFQKEIYTFRNNILPLIWEIFSLSGGYIKLTIRGGNVFRYFKF